MTGPFDGHGYVTTATPKLTVAAETGATVQFKINGAVIATATETAAGSGIYAATLLPGMLAVGPNSITADVADASSDSSVMTLIFAPDYSGGRYVVPGTPGLANVVDRLDREECYLQQRVRLFHRRLSRRFGWRRCPGQPGYAEAALEQPDCRHAL